MRTFIVRLQEDTAGRRPDAAAPRLRGFVDEVASGLRATFRDEQELLTALAVALAVDPPGPPWSGEQAARVSSWDLPDRTPEGN